MQMNGVQGMAEDADGSVLIAGTGGVRRVADGAPIVCPFPASLRESAGRRMLRDRDGALWVATGNGLVHLHAGRVEVMTQTDGLTSDVVSALFEDREGSIWVSTTDGLDRFRELPVVTYSKHQGVLHRVGALNPASEGGIWFDTVDSLDRMEQGRITAIRRRNVSGLLAPGMASLWQDRQGRVWLSGHSGVGYLQNGKFTKSVIPGGIIGGIAGDSAGNMWVVNLELGLLKLSPNSQLEQIAWQALGHRDAGHPVAADPSGAGVWVGFFKGGLVYFRDGRVLASYSAVEGLAPGGVNALRFEADGALWVATDGGLSRLRNGTIMTITRKNGLPCDAVYWTAEDQAHSLWIGTGCGLVRFPAAELDTGAIHATTFGSSDGIRNGGFAGGQTPHVAVSTDGKIWFSTPDGLSFVDPARMPFNKLPPPVHIESVRINRLETVAAEGLSLSHSSNDLEIRFTALSLVDSERVRFRYKLEGKDADWQDAGATREAFYGGLKPKHYTFRVIACNNDGVWNEAGAAWSFTIVPAWYQTWWFYTVAGLAGAGLILAVYQLRLKRVAAAMEHRYAVRLEERTRIARDLHDTLLQSLAGVSLQLDGVSKQLVTAPDRVPKLVARIREQVDSAFRETRVKVWNLRSTALEGKGLGPALREFLEKMGPTTAHCEVTVTGKPLACPPDVEEELLRIAQEAVNNANRHAQANAIRVALEYGVNWLALSISDDGRGFDLNQGIGKSGHWGLKNMQERAALVGAKYTIDTAAGKGTRIEIHVPLASWSLRNALKSKVGRG
jgi:signal transduction histidine kinase